MSNIDKAADIIDQWTQDGSELNSAVGNPRDIAKLLANKGLLAPELPEAEQVTDNLDVIDVNDDFAVSRYQGTVTLVVERPKNEHCMGAWSARQLALALLAAADYAEGK